MTKSITFKVKGKTVSASQLGKVVAKEMQKEVDKAVRKMVKRLDK